MTVQCTEQVGPGKGPLLGEDESSLAIYNISYLCVQCTPTESTIIENELEKGNNCNKLTMRNQRMEA